MVTPAFSPLSGHAAPVARRRRPGRARCGPLIVPAVLLILVAGMWTYRGFLPDSELGDDGFQVQITHVLALLQTGGLADASAESWLVWVHLGRLASAALFMAADLLAGPSGSLLLLLLLLGPLVRFRIEGTHRLVALLPLMLPLAVSGRSVLVAAGVGFFVLYLVGSKPRWYQPWFGLLLVNLSSASVLTSMLLLLFVRRNSPRSWWMAFNRIAVLVALALSFSVSLADKLSGFQGGEVGYEAYAFTSENPLVAALGRSTLVVSIVEEQYARTVVYLLTAGYLLFKLTVLLRNRRPSVAKAILLCCCPGVLIEGLGVLALFFPVFWLLAGPGKGRIDFASTLPTDNPRVRRASESDLRAAFRPKHG